MATGSKAHFDFTGKVALVTGGASGIGAACVTQFVTAGARVVILDRDARLGTALSVSINAAGGSALFIATDVSDAASCEDAVKRGRDYFGALDFAVNSAGITGATCRLTEYSVDDWQRVIDINLNGVFYCMRAQIKAMLDQGGGAIVNIASIMSQVSTPPTPAYTAAKHAVLGLTQAAAQAYSARGLRINALGPGYIRTPMMMNGTDAGMREKLTRRHPIGRLGEAADLAQAALFLCSPEAAFMAGGFYPVDGGYLVN